MIKIKPKRGISGVIEFLVATGKVMELQVNSLLGLSIGDL